MPLRFLQRIQDHLAYDNYRPAELGELRQAQASVAADLDLALGRQHLDRLLEGLRIVIGDAHLPPH
ncbi:MAG: hypothetical protein ACKOEP_01730, partial [Phycisphaerales bacterium]